MVEIFTVGGGDYLVNVFQAVAAWTGNGGYKSLLQVVMVMGLALSALTLAFNQDWRAWINWFLGATLMYSCLMVPRIDVHVTDRLNPSLAPANVSNVPLGLALMASFTSQVGDYLTGSAEVVFGLPGDLNYSQERHDLRRAALRCDAVLAHFRSRIRRQSRRAFPAMRVLRRAARPLFDEGARRDERHLGDDRAGKPGARAALPDPRR